MESRPYTRLPPDGELMLSVVNSNHDGPAVMHMLLSLWRSFCCGGRRVL